MSGGILQRFSPVLRSACIDVGAARCGSRERRVETTVFSFGRFWVFTIDAWSISVRSRVLCPRSVRTTICWPRKGLITPTLSNLSTIEVYHQIQYPIQSTPSHPTLAAYFPSLRMMRSPRTYPFSASSYQCHTSDNITSLSSGIYGGCGTGVA